MGREDFTRGQAIGHGSYGTVFKVEFHNRKIESRINKAVSADSTKPVFYALKEMMIQRFLAESRIKEVYIEKCVLANTDHPSIVKFYQSFRQGNKLYLLIEHCPQGSLHTFLSKNKKISNPLVKHFTAELVQALEYLRQIEIVHRDLKPGNIVLDPKLHIKLIDFATCKVFNKKISQ